MSKSKIKTQDVHTTITDTWIENFDMGEQEKHAYSKKYTSEFVDDHTDSGQDNPFWRLSILMRYGAYCKTAQQQLAKSHERLTNIENSLAKNSSEKLLDAYDCAESAITNSEAEYLIFRDLFEATYGEQWMGSEAYSAKLDEAFNPKTLGSSNGTPPSERTEQVWLKIRGRKSGRTVEQQKVFEHNVQQYIIKHGIDMIKQKPGELETMPKKEAQDILNDLINSQAKNK